MFVCSFQDFPLDSFEAFRRSTWVKQKQKVTGSIEEAIRLRFGVPWELWVFAAKILHSFSFHVPGVTVVGICSQESLQTSGANPHMDIQLVNKFLEYLFS